MLVTPAAAAVEAAGFTKSRARHPSADYQDELNEEDQTDEHPDRQVLQKSLPQLREVDVEHHHHEQEQDRDRAHVNDDQDHRQELGAEQEKQTRRIHESEDEKQDRVNRVLRGDHHERRRDHHRGEKR